MIYDVAIELGIDPARVREFEIVDLYSLAIRIGRRREAEGEVTDAKFMGVHAAIFAANGADNYEPAAFYPSLRKSTAREMSDEEMELMFRSYCGFTEH